MVLITFAVLYMDRTTWLQNFPSVASGNLPHRKLSLSFPLFQYLAATNALFKRFT